MSPVSSQVPNHLAVGARAGFITALEATNFPYLTFTEDFDMGAAEIVTTDLGAQPMPKQSPSGLTIQDYIERGITLKSEEWDITVHLEYNASKDDQTGGKLLKKVQSAGQNFPKHKNKRAFQFLNSGDGTTFGVGYDGVAFFAATHVDDGADYQTAQNNVGALNLSATNFNTTWALAKAFRDDRGEFEDHDHNLLIVAPSNRQMAAQIADNPNVEGTGNRDINSFQGELNYLWSSEMDTAAWIILSTNESIKPLILANRENPNLQHAWFDPDQPKGGWFLFKFYARYELFYGNWRLAYMGQS